MGRGHTRGTSRTVRGSESCELIGRYRATSDQPDPIVSVKEEALVHDEGDDLKTSTFRGSIIAGASCHKMERLIHIIDDRGSILPSGELSADAQFERRMQSAG